MPTGSEIIKAVIEDGEKMLADEWSKGFHCGVAVVGTVVMIALLIAAL